MMAGEVFDTEGNLIEVEPEWADGGQMLCPPDFDGPGDLAVYAARLEQTTTLFVRRVAQVGELFDRTHTVQIGSVSAPVGVLAVGALGAALLYLKNRKER